MEKRRRTGWFSRLVLVVAASLVVPAGLVSAVPPVRAAVGSPYSVTAPGLVSVVVANGNAYAANVYDNRVEVLSLSTRALLPPIPVGASPRGLDVSPDGKTLYVADYQGNVVSVVDLTLQREVRRFAMPTTGDQGHPASVAVASNGMVLLARDPEVTGGRPYLLQIDPATGVVRERTDWRPAASNEPIRLRASGDRSRIAAITPSSASFYDVATDTFVADRYLGNLSPLTMAVDGAGDKLLVGADTYVVDRNLVLRATIPGPDVKALAVDGPGTTGYRLRGGMVEVADLARALVTATIPLPGGATAGTGMALGPDGSSVVALTSDGFAVVPLSSAAPVSCPVPAAPAGVAAFCGASLSDVVLDGHGRAYASNPSRNQIEVVSLPDARPLPPIPVGSQPTRIDVTPDGKTLYAIDSGSDEISVVDLVTGREVGRITVPVTANKSGRPRSIAVASNGVALVTTKQPLSNETERLLQVDLGTGVVSEPTDSPVLPSELRPSGDHSHVALVGAGVGVYDAVTNNFGPWDDDPGAGTAVAVDGSAGHILLVVGLGSGGTVGTYVFDRQLVVRATVPDAGFDVALSSSGTTGFLSQLDAVAVVDVARGLVTQSIPLPEPVKINDKGGTGKVAVTADGGTVAVLTRSGVSVASMSASAPVPCPVPAVAPGVTALCSTHDGEVVADNHDAYVSNPWLDQVEVVSLATGTLEASIPVGSQPQGLDLSPDGRLLYVADFAAEEISVVDLSSRREVSRLTVRSPAPDERPLSIAIGDHGRALVASANFISGYGGGHILELDLATGATAVRTDYGTLGGRVSRGTIVRASRDRSRIMVVETTSDGPVARYDAATDRFDLYSSVHHNLTTAGVDGAGTTVLVGPGGFVLDEKLALEATIPDGGKGLVVNDAGTTGYRVQDSTVEVLDLTGGKVTGTLPMPEPVAYASGAVALSPDDTRLAVVTLDGVSVVPLDTALPAAYSAWTPPSG